MHGPVLRIKLNSCVAHMLYECPFSKNTAVPISIKQDRYYLYLNTYTNFFLGLLVIQMKNTYKEKHNFYYSDFINK